MGFDSDMESPPFPLSMDGKEGDILVVKEENGLH